MNRSSRLSARSLLPLAMSASAALGIFSLLPEPASAQAIGGFGQRTPNGALQPQPVYTSPMVNNTPMMPLPMQNNNAPVFSQRGGRYQAPPASVAPLSPPAATVNVMPQYNNVRIQGNPSERRGGYGPWQNGGVGTASPGQENSGRRSEPSYSTSPGVNDGHRPAIGGMVGSAVRVTTPIGQRSFPRKYYNNDYLYNAPVTIIGGPTLLGGFYYGNYCDTYSGQFCYPSVFSVYYGFPRYIVSPSLIVLDEPYYPAYYTNYLPFNTPTYQVTYNQNNYYVASEDSAKDIEKGGEPAKEAVKTSFPADSYQAAFADIEQAWNEGRVALLRKHLREDDVKLSVYFKGKYTYSIASADFAQITRDAFDRLNTVSFRFTRLRKAKNGDLTAYGKHVYRTSSDDASRQDPAVKADDTVPFSTDDSRMYDNANDPAAGEEKTVYVSYTLRRHDGQWYIVGVNSSPTDMVQDK